MTLDTLAFPSLLEERAKDVRAQCAELLSRDTEFKDVELFDTWLVTALARTIQLPQQPEQGPHREWRTAVLDFAQRQATIGVTACLLRYLLAAASLLIEQAPPEQRLESTSRLHWAILFGIELAARQSTLEIAQLASHSEVTGLRNRRGFESDLERIDQVQAEVQIAYIDMDGLKAINDKGSHQAGDEALRKLAAALSSELEDRATAYHFSGDEFGLVAQDMSHAQAEAMITRALDKVEHKFSYGIETLPRGDSNWKRARDAADFKMQQQKAERKAEGTAGIR